MLRVHSEVQNNGYAQEQKIFTPLILVEKPVTAVSPESVPSSQAEVRELPPKAHHKGELAWLLRSIVVDNYS